jgi:hypothetical protein
VDDHDGVTGDVARARDIEQMRRSRLDRMYRSGDGIVAKLQTAVAIVFLVVVAVVLIRLIW